MAPGFVALSGRRLASSGTWSIAVVGFVWVLGTAAVALKPAGRHWLREQRFKLLAVVVSSLLSFLLLGEVAVRAIEKRDEDGNVVVRARQLHPFRVPVKVSEKKLARHGTESWTSLVADPELGWAPTPSHGPPYAFDRSGIRVADPSTNYAEKPSGSALRVALFGDSFTNGIGVSQPETWAAELERQSPSGRLEVLNFGVPAYGMDQAFLRYRKTGRRFQPDVVVFGLQLENVARNVNVMRPFYANTTDVPLTKPFFALEGGSLRLLNSPTVPPDRIAATLRTFEDWPLARYERYYDPADYRARFWHASHLVTLAIDSTASVLSDLKPRETPSATIDLALRILHTFEQEATRDGARFLVFHLPIRVELVAALEGKPSPYAAERAAIFREFPVIESLEALKQAAGAHGVPALFNESMHYSPPANRAVASALVPSLLALPEPVRAARMP